MPIAKQIERQGAVGSPVVSFYPTVRAGVCDRCGVIDPNVESQFQYKLCEHYRGRQLWCSYCPSTTNPDEVIRYSILQVADDPRDSTKLIVWCNSSACLDKHYQKYQTNA